MALAMREYRPKVARFPIKKKERYFNVVFCFLKHRVISRQVKIVISFVWPVDCQFASPNLWGLVAVIFNEHFGK